jgi:hypothetical protein
VYERAEGVEDKKPFGTELDVYADGYTFMMHSVAPRPVPEDPVGAMRLTVGGEQCARPYSTPRMPPVIRWRTTTRRPHPDPDRQGADVKQTVAEILVDRMVGAGIDRVHGIVGDSANPR